MLAASVHYPIRGAVTFKGSVGVNVASDALANLASSGVTGGAMIIVGEDYGEGPSIMQQPSHSFDTKSQLWLLDPRPNLPSIVKAVKDGFALSEASSTPVILEVRIRSCHVTGAFEAIYNQAPPLTVAEALEHPRRRSDRVALPPGASHVVPIGQAAERRPGRDAVVFTWGWMVHEAVEAADALAAAGQGDVAVVDLRTLLPYDRAMLLERAADCH